LREATEKLYSELTASGMEVVYDDRGERAGVMFADWELMGIPHRIVLSDRGLDAGTAEYKGRRDAESQNIPFADLITFLKQRLSR
jgi:prolyl-tRNA synthetase